jgi:type I restriction enzyme M protein
LNYDNLTAIKQALQFTADGGVNQKWYARHECAITIDERKKKIIYPASIQLGDDTTANFSHPENLVVLECVDRLLRKGYRPEDLHLEKKWSLGRTQKGGKADIIIRGSDGKTLLIIECKTWGAEYEKEKRRMQSNGGQLFSYLQQEHSTQYLCLYTSTIENGEVRFENAIIHIEDDAKLLEQAEKSSDEIRLYRDAKNVENFHLAWKESYSCYFHPNGIFDEDVQPYHIRLKALTLKDLKEIKQGDSGFIHNQFAEILRHNNISDKENAFNKMISLFLCKVVDENRGEKDELAFQWKEGVDSYEDLQDRLLKLYHEGMEIYLKENIVYYGNDYVEAAFKHHKKAVAKDLMNEMLKALKFYTNNEFAFKEVHNKKLFEQNSKVVNEVVQLLQPYRIKYSNKQQFLGNLFELLLNDGLKQSEGQFFTPIPITRLILSSLPIRELIESRMAEGLVNRLPRVVDYACGSGHFLTEAIDEIQASIEVLNISDYRDNTGWARDYIFGIEKDYRLARTAKIACFLNGAGDAQIIYGDGLEDHADLGGRESFDILIANPPYSIKDFKQHLRLKHNSFELLPFISDSASEIETLFIERIRQLLRPGGMAGIVLPSSILSNSGIYTRAREIILKHFHLRAVVELGGQTFIATNTNTVILFLQKRTNEDSKHFAYRCDTLFDDGLLDDPEFQDNHLLQNYCRQIGVAYDDYVSLAQKQPTDALKKSEFLTAYRRWFDGLTEIVKLKENNGFKKKTVEVQQNELEFLFLVKVLEREKEKFFYFCLAHGQQVVIVKAGDKEKEKAFLGYEWSKRRGQEGMKFVGTGKLYDAADFGNPAKVNSYIRQAFLNETPGAIHESIADHVSYARLIDMMDFTRIEFDKQIGLSFKNAATVESKWPLVKFGSIASLEYGKSLPASKRIFGDFPVVGSNGIDGYHSEYIVEGPAIIIGRKGSAGKVNLVTPNCFPIDTTYFLKIDVHQLEQKFVFYLLQKLNLESLVAGAGVPGLNRNDVYEMLIPLPPLDVQRKIIKEIEIVENQAAMDVAEVELQRENIHKAVTNLTHPLAAIGSISEINPGKSHIRGFSDDMDVSFIEMASVSNEGVIETIAARKLTEVKQGYTCFANGDVILAKITPCMENGKCGYVEGLTNNVGFGSTEFFVLRPGKNISGKFLYYLINRDTFRKEAEKHMTGSSGHRRVPKTFLESYQIPIPPIKDQTRIVTELDTREKRIRELKAVIEAAEVKKAEILDGYLT